MPVETNRLVIDGNVVGKISSRLLALGEKATGARTKLVSGAEALGTCWGDRDEFSRTFAKEYLPNRNTDGRAATRSSTRRRTSATSSPT